MGNEHGAGEQGDDDLASQTASPHSRRSSLRRMLSWENLKLGKRRDESKNEAPALPTLADSPATTDLTPEPSQEKRGSGIFRRGSLRNLLRRVSSGSGAKIVGGGGAGPEAEPPEPAERLSETERYAQFLKRFEPPEDTLMSPASPRGVPSNGAKLKRRRSTYKECKRRKLKLARFVKRFEDKNEIRTRPCWPECETESQRVHTEGDLYVCYLGKWLKFTSTAEGWTCDRLRKIRIRWGLLAGVQPPYPTHEVFLDWVVSRHRRKGKREDRRDRREWYFDTGGQFFEKLGNQNGELIYRGKYLWRKNATTHELLDTKIKIVSEARLKHYDELLTKIFQDSFEVPQQVCELIIEMIDPYGVYRVYKPIHQHKHGGVPSSDEDDDVFASGRFTLTGGAASPTPPVVCQEDQKEPIVSKVKPTLPQQPGPTRDPHEPSPSPRASGLRIEVIGGSDDLDVEISGTPVGADDWGDALLGVPGDAGGPLLSDSENYSFDERAAGETEL